VIIGYFADIDARSHQYGAFSERAMSAVANKTKILQKVVDIIDDKTVLLITADHGHVDVGGHSGIDESVLTIPFIIYKKNSNLASRTLTENQVCYVIILLRFYWRFCRS
jgi:predicted AlkP superfamily pyrophosphatase or phosphodiesterase